MREATFSILYLPNSMSNRGLGDLNINICMNIVFSPKLTPFLAGVSLRIFYPDFMLYLAKFFLSDLAEVFFLQILRHI